MMEGGKKNGPTGGTEGSEKGVLLAAMRRILGGIPQWFLCMHGASLDLVAPELLPGESGASVPPRFKIHAAFTYRGGVSCTGSGGCV